MTGPHPSHVGRTVCFRGLMRGTLLALVAGLALATAGMAQTPPSAPTKPTADLAAVGVAGDLSLAPSLDFAAWEKLASRVEKDVAANDTPQDDLDQMRGQLVDWRQAFQVAQNTNATRIATLRQQIAALGAVPKEGEVEAPEIASRRQELTDQLVRLQAPGIAADEAYRRADGLIKEIDRLQRERQTHELLQLWPAPINPANWPDAIESISGAAGTFSTELITRARHAEVHAKTLDNLPLILVLVVFGIGLIWRGVAIVERLTRRVLPRLNPKYGLIVSFALSLGEIILPTLGGIFLWAAVTLTTLMGTVADPALDTMPVILFIVSVAVWLGGRLFPAIDAMDRTFRMTADRRAEGRFLTSAFGWLIGLEALRLSALSQVVVSEAALALLAYPFIIVGGILLIRIGLLLRTRQIPQENGEERASYFDRLIALLGQAAVAIGIAGPVLASVGYVAAASALVLPAATTLALVGLLAVLHRLVGAVYGAVTGKDEFGQDALLPVLFGFGMTVASVPVFALIWGARWSDLTELWNRFQEGYTLGEANISPTDFLYVVLVFGIGFALTRLLQGALRGSILPRTALDQGGQNAVVSGVGYLGIFVSAIVAINTVGIDLSGLTVVAGALSVGIGFGMQAIVGNFVSGIILLIERPVSEGDWIEVGGVQGTVKSISVRSTRIQTFDRTDVIVPNQDLVTGRVTNWTRFNLSGRLIVPVSVAYGSDTRKVERVLAEIAEAQPLVLLNPPPSIVFNGFTSDAMLFEIRVILRDVNFSLSVRSEMNHQIVARFAEEGIEIPFAQRELRLRDADVLARALRGEAPLPAPHPMAEAPRRPVFRDEIPDPDPEDDASAGAR